MLPSPVNLSQYSHLKKINIDVLLQILTVLYLHLCHVVPSILIKCTLV